jgi:hypothetical protein
VDSKDVNSKIFNFPPSLCRHLSTFLCINNAVHTELGFRHIHTKDIYLESEDVVITGIGTIESQWGS